MPRDQRVVVIIHNTDRGSERTILFFLNTSEAGVEITMLFASKMSPGKECNINVFVANKWKGEGLDF